jgi:hypothetical protein
MTRSLSAADLAVLYRQADVGLVTPLLDGMNLVAKEYVLPGGRQRACSYSPRWPARPRAARGADREPYTWTA